MRKAIWIFLLGNALQLNAQDIHLSQFMVSDLVLNPALVGNQSEDYKVNLQKRTQWSSVADPFNTFLVGYNAKQVWQNVSVGAVFLYDVAGDADFTTTTLNSAINQTLIISANQKITGGILLGFSHRKVDYSKLIFEETESLPTPAFAFFDLGLGANFQKEVNQRFSFNGGFSAFHINKPKQSLTGGEVKLEEKYNTYFLSDYRFNNTIVFSPSLLFTKQQKTKEWLMGSALNYQFNNETDLILKLYYRWNDAFIPAFGLRFNRISAVLSYDINISDLSVASNNRGGFEFSLIYLWSKKRVLQQSNYNCPKYL